jgi:hypothetical protein
MPSIEKVRERRLCLHRGPNELVQRHRGGSIQHHQSGQSCG